jgi:hypothetical protein
MIIGAIPAGRLGTPARSPEPASFSLPTTAAYIAGAKPFVDGGFAQI